MSDVVIVSAVRTAVGSFGGTLRDVPAVNLGSLVINEVLKRARLRPKSGDKLLNYAPELLKNTGLIDLEKTYYNWDDSLKEVQIDEVIMGNVLLGGQGQNPGRQASIYAGIPKETGAYTVNKLCGSGLKAITLGAEAIMLGQAEIVIAGGMESMSSAPYALPRARWGYRMDVTGTGEIYDLMVYDALLEKFYGYHMGMTAENIAEKYGITREEQDELGLLSHQRARAAISQGILKDETVPVIIPQKKGDPIVFDTDERPMDTSLEKMAKLAPVFKKDGTVTAGNSSGVNDGAAAVVLMTKDKAKELGLEPMGILKSYAWGAVDPAYMGLGVIPSVKKAMDKANMTVADIQTVELNEAFAAQALACIKELGLGLDKTNLWGSGISVGHPVGCTAAKLVVTLLHDMKRRNLNSGMVTMCIGGGQGMAAIFER